MSTTYDLFERLLSPWLEGTEELDAHERAGLAGSIMSASRSDLVDLVEFLINYHRGYKKALMGDH